jgi:type 1 fimbria pilin
MFSHISVSDEDNRWSFSISEVSCRATSAGGRFEMLFGDGSDISNRTIAIKIISIIPSAYAESNSTRVMIRLLSREGRPIPIPGNNKFAKRVPIAGRDLYRFSRHQG